MELPAHTIAIGLSSGAARSTDCPYEGAVQPGRWQVESVREGEEPAFGIADVMELDGGCVLVERLLLHFDDGTSHHVFFVQGWDPEQQKARFVQIGDHPLFLVWAPESDGEAYRTTRKTTRGTVDLRWVVRSSADGFVRELMVRRDPASEWSSSEVMTYRPLPVVGSRSELPALRPGAFHDPDACAGPVFREMDYMLGDWFNDEWVREGGNWTPATVSRVSVRSLLGGCAILEEHPIYDEGLETTHLLLLRGYDTSRERWRQVVFDLAGGVWEWKIEERDDGWLLSPEGGAMAGRLRIFEQADSAGVLKRVETRGDDGQWALARLIRYAPP